MSRFYIVPPGADIVSQENKKQSLLQQYKRRKEERVSNEEARQLAEVEQEEKLIKVVYEKSKVLLMEMKDTHTVNFPISVSMFQGLIIQQSKE
eukprot:6974659-Ditylum_brightwellii.AAC.1